MKIGFGRLIQVVVLALLASTAAWSAPRYTLTELCLPTGVQYSSSNYVYAYGVNNQGQVVGQVVTNYSNTTAVRWDSSGRVTTISQTIPGSSGLNISWAINDSGVVVGRSGAYKPAYWQNGGTTASYLASTGDARDINNSGQVVGFNGTNVVIWDDGQTISTGIAQPSGSPKSGQHFEAEISENGKVAATTIVNGKYRGSYWDGTSVVDIGTLDAYPGYWPSSNLFCYAYGVNDSGQVVGCTTVSSFWQAPKGHAFVWKSGTMMDLGTLGTDAYSSAYHINNKGQVVGWSSTREDGQASRAFLYESGQMIDLNSCIDGNSDWHLDSATCINESGQVVGYGTKKVGNYSYSAAFLLTPVVPEPSSLLALFGGLVGVGGMVWRRRRI